jgi:hypothetical protein
VNISFRIVDAEQIQASLVSYRDGVKDALVEKVNELVQMLYERILDKTSGEVLNPVTGRLDKSIYKEYAAPNKAGTGFIGGYVTQDARIAPYGPIQEFGSKTGDFYLIYPGNKRMLVFEGAKGLVFARKVNHPPIQMRSFMLSSLEEIRSQVPEGIRATIKDKTFSFGRVN